MITKLCPVDVALRKSPSSNFERPSNRCLLNSYMQRLPTLECRTWRSSTVLQLTQAFPYSASGSIVRLSNTDINTTYCSHKYHFIKTFRKANFRNCKCGVRNSISTSIRTRTFKRRKGRHRCWGRHRRARNYRASRCFNLENQETQ